MVNKEALSAEDSQSNPVPPFWFLGEEENPGQIQLSDEWFYHQRAFPLNHIPAGARLKAFQHMQRMMEEEGKLVRRPDGSYAAASIFPQGGPLSPVWIPRGPAPTTGGDFQPVSGRVTAIAVDPNDPSGNTVLIGGAQGGIWRSTDAGLHFTAVGDQNPSLAMGSIAFAPSQPLTVYAGTGEQASVGFDIYYGAGVLKSTDGGLHWVQTCTVTGPTCPFIGPYSSFQFGFFNDGGARISYVAVNPSNPNLVLVAAHIPQTGVSLTAGGVYCSDDAGATWSSIPSASGEMATFVGFANATTAYAALGRPSGSLTGANPNGIYKSANADGGLTKKCSSIVFSNATANGIAGLPASSFGRIDLGIASADNTGKTVYASIADASASLVTGRSRASRTNLGIFKTIDGGATWINTNAPDVCQQQCWYDNVIKVDPSNSNIIYFGGSSHVLFSPPLVAFEWVIRSMDGGVTWNPAIPTTPAPGDPTLPHVDEHALAFARVGTKMSLYLGNDGGVWRTDDAEASTVTWTNLNNYALQLTQFYPSLSIHPSNPSLGFAGTQDNGSQNFTGKPLSPTDDWVNNQACGDGGWTLIDPVTPSTVYILCQVLSLQKSVTNGTPGSFRRATNGIARTDPVNFIAPMAIDPANSNRLYFGTSRVYQTLDGADSWLPISADLSFPAPIVAMAVGGSTGDNTYAGTADGKVFIVSHVAPGEQVNVAQLIGGLPTRTPTQFVVDPSDPTGLTVYVTFSGFSGFSDFLGHVFKAGPALANWIDISCTHVGNCGQPNPKDLPNIPVNDLVIDPDLPGTLYAATDLGVFTTNDGGATWTSLNNNSLPNVAVLSLRLHEPSRTLRAATHGRGAWDLPLNNFGFTGPHVTDISPTFANTGDPVVSLAVNGSGFTCNSRILFTLNGATSSLTPTFCSSAQLVTLIPGADLPASGDAQVTVTDSGPPIGNSNAMTFTVLGGIPSVLSCTSSTPAAPPASSCTTPVQPPAPARAVTITLNGNGFTANSQLTFNRSSAGIKALAPTAACALPACLLATIPANLLGTFGSTNDIAVVNPPPGGGTSSPPAPFQVVAPPPPNDNFASAMNIANSNFSDIQDSSGATTETSDPMPACAQNLRISSVTGRANTVWYKFTPSSSGTANLDTIGSNYDTVLSIWTGTQGNLSPVPTGCNDDIQQGVIQSQLVNIPLTSGITYFIMVSSFGVADPNPIAFGGKSVFNFQFTSSPDFSVTSTGTTTQTVNAGQSASFTNAITIAALSGFASPVNLSCSLPFNATATTCSVSPNSFPTGAGTATVNVTTTVRGFVPPSFPPTHFFPLPQFFALLLLSILLAVLLLSTARTRRQRFAGVLPFAFLLLFIFAELTGCGGGGAGPPPPPPPTGTPAGTYTVTVTATSGATTHTSALTLKVN